MNIDNITTKIKNCNDRLDSLHAKYSAHVNVLKLLDAKIAELSMLREEVVKIIGKTVAEGKEIKISLCRISKIADEIGGES